MAAKANQQTEAEMQPQDSAAEAQDNDAAQQTLKTLMRLGKERGYVTHDELNAALPAEDFTSEQIDDFMSTLNEMGVSVVEAADSDDSSEGEARNSALRAMCPTAMYPAPTILCACIFARWAASSCCRARARSRLPNVSRPVES